MRTAVLIATADPWLLDGLLRLAAAADAEVGMARSVEPARAAWRHPRIVLVGADLAVDLARSGIPRRPGVVLVTDPAGSEEDPYRLAVGIGAQDVVVLPDGGPMLIDLMAATREQPAGRAVTLCVAGGRGGAGASVLSAMLGLVAARHRRRALLIDGDPLGGGLDLVLGREQVTGARWPEFAGTRGRLSGTALHESLPGVGRGGSRPHDLGVLSCHRDEPGAVAEPIPPQAMRSVLEAAERGFELVVVDLPRQIDDAAAEALRMADAALLVVPLEVRAAAAATRVAAGLRRFTEDLRLVARGPAPGGLTAGDVATALGLPLAGQTSRDRRVPGALEDGRLPAASRRGPLAALCGRLLTDFGVIARPGMVGTS